MLFAVGVYPVKAQNIQKMDIWQDSLFRVGQQMFQRTAEAERLERNFVFIKTLVSALKEPNSYLYNFDKLDMISVLSSPDHDFRIFSWNIPLQDGSYLYYGTIQYQVSGGQLKLTPLLDRTFVFEKPTEEITSSEQWYGAQYYEIIPLSKRQYVLLGWKGHQAEYSKKVIEILSVSPTGDITLGAPVFTDNPKMTRKIFSYARTATMYLRYNENSSRIEFDHIVAIAPEYKGKFQYYGPDLTHDAYQVKSGKLVFKENITLQAVEDGKENLYIDPLKPKNSQKSGIR
ncbi:hypothetical protein G5B30_05980 [Sphingobacterium sp. SGG-5]|nr:hypothetical protein [Sphingobacterium sp. SGG-5]